MMIKSLLKIRLKSIICGMLMGGKRGTAKKSIGRAVLFSFLYLYLGFALVLFSSLMAISLGSVLIPMGASWLYFAMFSLVTVSFVFFFGVFETKAEIFEGKDNELLLSMPIKPSAIVGARLSMVMIYNYIESAVIMIPAAVVYAIYTGFEPLGFFGAIIMGILLPLFASSLASGVGYLLSLLTRKIKSKTFFSVALSLAFIVLYMALYSRIVNGMDSFLENLGNSVDSIRQNYGILYYLGAAAMLYLPAFIPVALVCALGAFIAYRLISRSYISLVTDIGGAEKTVYKEKKARQRSAVFALVKKEFFKLKSSSLYILNSAIGFILTVALSVAAFIKRDAIFAVMGQMGLLPEWNAPIFIAVLVFLTSVNMMSASALSLEGDNLWILKTLPIDAKTALISKCLPQIILGVPFTIVSATFFYFASGARLYYLPFFILVPLLANAASSFFGLIMNVAFPKFSYDNEAEVIKQSAPVFLTMMTQSIFNIAFVFMSIALAVVNPLLAVAAGTLLMLLISAVLLCILLFVSSRVYEKISV